MQHMHIQRIVFWTLRTARLAVWLWPGMMLVSYEHCHNEYCTHVFFLLVVIYLSLNVQVFWSLEVVISGHVNVSHG